MQNVRKLFLPTAYDCSGSSVQFRHPIFAGAVLLCKTRIAQLDGAGFEVTAC